ncbi:MAG: ABC transporter ATP-binding protein [Burkholderiaceae bacterium]
MANQEICVRFENFSAGYTDTPIVRDVSLQITKGTVTTLIGGNGAGKSTLLKSLFGMTRQFGGKIYFEGNDITGTSPHQRLAAGIGLVPQGRCNFPYMSVRENIEMGAYSLPKSRAREAQERVVALFPMLKEKWNQLAGDLSGGEQQILETAMVLETSPRLLLLDEPSLGLSPIMQQKIFDSVCEIRDAGLTVLMVEQNADGALNVSDRAIVLELGTIALEGEAKSVRVDPKVKAAYLGGM